MDKAKKKVESELKMTQEHVDDLDRERYSLEDAVHRYSHSYCLIDIMLLHLYIIIVLKNVMAM